jgi:hypothetical protein
VGELKIFGYILVAVLFLSAIVMPLVEMFFVYRERQLLGDALYNSCRAAAEGSYYYEHMRNVNAKRREDAFKDVFADTFATSFDLYCTSKAGATLQFKSNNGYYGDFKVELEFKEEYHSADDKTVVKVTATATSPYKFKTNFMESIHKRTSIKYELKSIRFLTMEVIN